jgi:dihydroxyacetone kinase-like protein
MGERLSLAQFEQWLLLYAARIEEQEAYLTELDAAIGDADHGVNMQRGMTQVRKRLAADDEAPADVGKFLRSIAMTLISSVGGAAGPLYGAFFLRAAADVNGNQEIELAQLAVMFRDGLEGIKQRGKAQLNDKTMIDTLEPAVRALEDAASTEDATLADALAAARRAAENGMRHTIALEAQKGRASYLGERSIGHQDPGATSSYYLIECAAEAFGE